MRAVKEGHTHTVETLVTGGEDLNIQDGVSSSGALLPWSTLFNCFANATVSLTVSCSLYVHVLCNTTAWPHSSKLGYYDGSLRDREGSGPTCSAADHTYSTPYFWSYIVTCGFSIEP